MWNRNKIPAFTNAHHWCVSQSRWAQSVNSHPISLMHTLIISSHVHQGLSSDLILSVYLAKAICLFPYVQHVLPSVASPQSKNLSEYLTFANRIEARNHGAQSISASQSPRYPIHTTVLMIRHCGYMTAEPANDKASGWHSWCDTAQAVSFFKTIICWVCIVEWSILFSPLPPILWLNSFLKRLIRLLIVI